VFVRFNGHSGHPVSSGDCQWISSTYSLTKHILWISLTFSLTKHIRKRLPNGVETAPLGWPWLAITRNRNTEVSVGKCWSFIGTRGSYFQTHLILCNWLVLSGTREAMNRPMVATCYQWASEIVLYGLCSTLRVRVYFTVSAGLDCHVDLHAFVPVIFGIIRGLVQYWLIMQGHRYWKVIYWRKKSLDAMFFPPAEVKSCGFHADFAVRSSPGCA